MASVRKQVRKNGATVYQVLWSVTDANGKRRQPSKVFASHRVAKAFAAEKEREERYGYGDPHKLTVARYLDHWLASLKKRNELSPSTLSSYEHYAALLADFIGNIRLTRLTPLELDRAYAEMLASGGTGRGRKTGTPARTKPLSARSVLQAHRIARVAFEAGRRWKLISTNPAADASPPQPKKSKVRALTPEEADRVWQTACETMKGGRCHPGLDVAVMMLMTMALRRSELLGTCWDAVDLDNRRLEIRRSLVQAKDGSPLMREENKSEGSRRTLSIPDFVVGRLREYRALILRQALAYGKEYQRDPYFLVFPEHGGVMPTPSAWTARLRKLISLAGVASNDRLLGHLQPAHGFRHTAATVLLANNVDIKTISQRLGHSSPRVTLDVYVHGSAIRDERAGEILAAQFSVSEKVTEKSRDIAETAKNGN